MPQLYPGLCRQRRLRFAALLTETGLDLALITDSRHLNYFFGLEGRGQLPAAALLHADGSAILSRRSDAAPVAPADEEIAFEPSYLATQREDLCELALASLAARMAGSAPVRHRRGRDALAVRGPNLPLRDPAAYPTAPPQGH